MKNAGRLFYLNHWKLLTGHNFKSRQYTVTYLDFSVINPAGTKDDKNLIQPSFNGKFTK